MRSSDDVLIVEDSYAILPTTIYEANIIARNFPDSMTTDWSPKLISTTLMTLFAPKMAKLSPKVAPESNIDVLITFDATGVSSHPNHKSLFHGSLAFMKALMRNHSGWEHPVALYTLTSVSILRKYVGIFDAPMSLAACVFTRKETGNLPSPLLSVSGVSEYRTAQKAMTKAHVSQMRWFRWGWIGVGRYMVVNDLRKVRVR